MGDRVYLDHNATTPLDPRVLEAMLPFLREHYGNASSVHREGRLARQAVEQAREQVAAAVGAHPSQVVFTGGGTEANNLALKGYQAMHPAAALWVSAVEHSSVLAPAKLLGGHTLAVDAQGRCRPEAIAEHIKAGDLVSVLQVNNETGVVQDLAAVADLVRAAGAVLHSDAVQALGKVKVDMNQMGAHLLTLSSHKVGGAPGVGALVVDKAVSLLPQLHGGGQEKGRRSGSLNVAGIVGFGKAAELVAAEGPAHGSELGRLRLHMEQRLKAAVPNLVVFAETAERVGNTCFCGVPGIDGEALVLALDDAGFAVSSGAACDSNSGAPSHVLTAMGIDEATARGAIRISLGAGNSVQDIDNFVATIGQLVTRLGRMARSW